jgi:hypothetical protein
LHVLILLNNSSVSWHARANSTLLSTLSSATTGSFGDRRPSCDETVLDGDASILLGWLGWLIAPNDYCQKRPNVVSKQT